jgi:ribonuclease E
MIINNMKSLSEVERSQVFAAFDSVGPIAPTTAPAETKKPRANAGKPTCHGDFTKKILAEQKEAVTAFKLANPEMKGSHLTFVAVYKKEHPEEVEEFKKQWELEHPTEVPVVPEATETTDAKPKRVMSDEQKAKMKAGREAAAAAKKASAPEPVAEPVPVPMAEPEAKPEAKPDAKKRGPKKLTDMTPEELAIHEARKAERKAKKESGSGTTSPARSVSPKEKAE